LERPRPVTPETSSSFLYRASFPSPGFFRRTPSTAGDDSKRSSANSDAFVPVKRPSELMQNVEI